MPVRRPQSRAFLCAVLVLCLLAPALPLRAAITPQARAILDRYIAATGGRDAWAAESTMRVRVSLQAMGLQGTHFAWSQRPDRAAGLTHLGPFVLREGTIGGRAWRVDQNGRLQWLDGKDLESAISGAFFENDLWMGPDQGGAQVKHLAPEREGKTELDVLEVVPPTGRPRRFYFDAATGLLVKSTQQDDARSVEVRLSGYERNAGRLRPADTRTLISGHGSAEITAHVESLWLNVPLDSSDFLPPGEKKKDYAFLAGARSARAPMRYGERHVWVRASVNGAAPEDFLLDTGASATVLDSAFAAKLGLELQGTVEGAGAAGTGTVRFARIASLRVAGEEGQGVEVRDQQVGVLALNRYIAPFFWREAAGVLGYDFISRFVVTVDFAGHRLTLEEPEGFRYAGKGAELELGLANNIPVVRARLDSLEADFRLDVGSGGSVDLHGPFTRAHGLARKVAKTVPTPAGGFGGTFTVQACRFGSFTLGPYTIESPLGSLSEATTGVFASENYAGIVGNRILDRFTATFDYAHKKLYLEPNENLERRDPGDRFGAGLMKEADRFRVASVVAGSPAAAAGLREGDEVLKVAGRALSGAAPDDVLGWVNAVPDGGKLVVEVRREGKSRKLKLRPRPLL